jgi:putative ABC transport system permease protein
MVTLSWLGGLLRHRGARPAAIAAGVAVGVALLASIGAFMSSTAAKMTDRAITRVAADWQVELSPGTRTAAVLGQIRHFGGVEAAQPVLFARTSGLSATSGGTTQTTGPGRVLGLPPRYEKAFPGELRVLAGRGAGVLLAQQTAANLHARPGSVVRIGGGPTVRVDGIVDLPAADSLFQRVGAPPGSQASAPPDNVILVPPQVLARVRGPVTTQVHVRLRHVLPHSPSAAFTAITGRARNLETRLAGRGLVGDNLGTELDAARSDALYAQVLFLFLGVPGALLAALITASIASAGAEGRRRDAAVLRARGASTRQLARLALAEAAVAGGVGVAVGLAAALAVGKLAFGAAGFGAGPVAAVAWGVGATATGLAVALASVALPAWRDARGLTVAGQRLQVGRRGRPPWWMRSYADVIALVGAALVYWQASRSGYQLVLAPEGTPQVSVNWYALLAPVLAWIGAGLLAYRLAHVALARGQVPLTGLLRPVAGRLAPTVVATMGRQRHLLARALALVALAIAFAGSTAVFDATYQQQAEVDARLTNGADVTVTESPGAHVGPAGGAALQTIRGVRSVEPLQHRFAYVGADLQDLYGVRPGTIGGAGKLQNAWFAGGTASELMARLRAQPDSVLVSAETVRDFQLRPGDQLRLRLQDVRTKRFTTVPFRYEGVSNEFPTAPTDSFLVANADYVAQKTGSPAVGSFLVQTDGTDAAVVANRIRAQLGSTVKVTDIARSRRVVGSNLTAVELTGLTKVELSFALLLAVTASGLALALRFGERRRTFAIAAALGARPRQLGGFVWGESLFVAGGGLVIGAAIAGLIAFVLVKVLTGVFDPPPDVPAIPWSYLAAVAGLTALAVAAAGATALRALRGRAHLGLIRES